MKLRNDAPVPRFAWILCGLALTLSSGAAAEPTQLLWGDTHLHTSYSFDAYLNRNMTADPDTAYRYAKGLPVIHPYHRARVQIETPLDFLVVADHAEYLGVIRTIVDEGIVTDDLGVVDQARAAFTQWWLRGVVEDDEGTAAFRSLLPADSSVEQAAAEGRVGTPIPNAETMSRTAWQESVKITDRHYQPGTFTSLIGWEWSSIPAGANLHRVVFTSAGADVASRFMPYGSDDSMYPEDLWAWLERTSQETGAEFVAIPHNSNISKGYMFAETSLRGEPIDEDYTRRRLAFERVAEVTQIKGDSETHPVVSPDDPFADFETYEFYIEQNPVPYAPGPGDYVRSALLRGLELEGTIGVNPFRLGMIGSTDSHTGAASAEEPNFWGKLARDSIPENKVLDRGGWGPTGWDMSASGLAAVWAAENTREAILAAFQRREVYATTGPRIGVRVFGGYGFTEADLAAPDLGARGYAKGVPMGGGLESAPGGAAPRLLIQVAKDPVGAHLDRVQIIKGWRDASGRSHERVYDVAWSDEREPGPDGTLPPVGNTVDLGTATYTNDIGAPELSTVWEDPDFDASQSAFYYVRVLQIPTPRHALYDALALGTPLDELVGPPTIQERAYTSPIWYAP